MTDHQIITCFSPLLLPGLLSNGPSLPYDDDAVQPTGLVTPDAPVRILARSACLSTHAHFGATGNVLGRRQAQDALWHSQALQTGGHEARPAVATHRRDRIWCRIADGARQGHGTHVQARPIGQATSEQQDAPRTGGKATRHKGAPQWSHHSHTKPAHWKSFLKVAPLTAAVTIFSPSVSLHVKNLPLRFAEHDQIWSSMKRDRCIRDGLGFWACTPPTHLCCTGMQRRPFLRRSMCVAAPRRSRSSAADGSSR